LAARRKTSWLSHLAFNFRESFNRGLLIEPGVWRGSHFPLPARAPFGFLLEQFRASTSHLKTFSVLS
jgi:hypothetical protein